MELLESTRAIDKFIVATNKFHASYYTEFTQSK